MLALDGKGQLQNYHKIITTQITQINTQKQYKINNQQTLNLWLQLKKTGELNNKNLAHMKFATIVKYFPDV